MLSESYDVSLHLLLMFNSPFISSSIFPLLVPLPPPLLRLLRTVISRYVSRHGRDTFITQDVSSVSFMTRVCIILLFRFSSPFTSCSPSSSSPVVTLGGYIEVFKQTWQKHILIYYTKRIVGESYDTSLHLLFQFVLVLVLLSRSSSSSSSVFSSSSSSPSPEIILSLQTLTRQSSASSFFFLVIITIIIIIIIFFSSSFVVLLVIWFLLVQFRACLGTCEVCVFVFSVTLINRFM